MAIQTILNGLNIISVDDTKYVINTYNDAGFLEIVDVRTDKPFPVCRIYAGLTHWVVTPAKFDKSKSDAVQITLD